jgi:Uncharacterised protein family UPF0547
MSAILAMLASSSSDGSGAAFLVLVLVGSLVFAWIVGIAQIAGTPEEGFATGTRTTWLLLVIFTGLIGLVAYVLVGRNRGSWASNRHRVLIDPSDNMYWCTDCDFASYEMKDVRAHGISSLSPITRGRRPTLEGEDASSSPPAMPLGEDAVGSGETVTSPDQDTEASGRTSTAPIPETKTCPDCAEEVRPAARKCRFCGYMFEDASVGS